MEFNLYQLIEKKMIKYILISLFVILLGIIIKNINITFSYKLYYNQIYNEKYNYPYFKNPNYDDVIKEYIINQNNYDDINYRITTKDNSVNIFFIKQKDNVTYYDNILFTDEKNNTLNNYLNIDEKILIYNIKEKVYQEYNIALNDLKIEDIKFEIQQDNVKLYILNDVSYVEILMDESSLTKSTLNNDQIIADKFIAFTFDDGPSIYTSEIMDILDKYNYKATFFEVGNMITKYPEVTKEVVDRGYEVGNHTTDHSNLNRLTESKIKDKVYGNNTLFNEITGQNMELVRCPYGNSNKKVRATINNPIIYWSVDSRDWESRNTEKIVELVKNTTKDGDIILFHDLYSTTLESIEILAEYFYLNGYKVVSVSELFELKGKELVPHQIHYNAR